VLTSLVKRHSQKVDCVGALGSRTACVASDANSTPAASPAEIVWMRALARGRSTLVAATHAKITTDPATDRSNTVSSSCAVATT
jgi:hypothetical protein